MNNRLLILGGGFGIYGYLPAALKANWNVATLSRYKADLNARVELSNLVHQVSFVDENNLDPNSYDAVVVARTPQQQVNFIRANPSFSGHLFLEKPLGDSVNATTEVLDFLEFHKLRFSIAYLFQYQDWYQKIFLKRHSGYKVMIDWRITPNVNQNWKNEIGAGGGVLSYYGVHLLSLIIDCEYSLGDLIIKYDPNCLEVTSTNLQRPLNVKLSIDKTAAFKVDLDNHSNGYHWSGISPFGIKPTAGLPDPRVPALIRYLSDEERHQNLVESISKERKILEFRQTIFNLL